MTTTSTGTHGTAGLGVRGIVKRYSGVPVLHGVSVDVRPGDVVGLVGHNGAGKSTLLRVISGATTPEDGRIVVDGADRAIDSPAAAIGAGIATVYQELALLPNLTVAQNVHLGAERSRAGLLRREAMRDDARRLVEQFGIDVDVDRRLGDYPVATRQMLEIAVATHRKARYLLLDEPTTSLEGGQVERLLEMVRSLAAGGMGVVFVDHKLDELYAVCNRVVALVDGRVRIDARVDEVSRHDVVAAIAGDEAAEADEARRRSPDGDVPAEAGTTGAAAAAPVVADVHRWVPQGVTGPRLEVRDLVAPGVHGVSLTAEPGRVLGLYGLVGAGRTEVLRALVGLAPVTSGTVTLDGRPYRPTTPARAQRAGVVYLTEERKSDGIVPALDSPMNVALPVLRRYRRAGLLDKPRMLREADALLGELRVRGDRHGPVVSLSGGNQQKVLLARAIAQHPRVLLLDEPTKGVDLGVKAEIHRIVRALAHEGGLTVVLVSSEEEEICDVADDIVVVSHGRSTGEQVPPDHRTPHALRTAAWAAA
ncbi:sugar ABC transporter ATP-binding protein [Cellulomonas iranensis]|uniref:Ribose transport system ATP-binding protein n=1 Tax=Cellulomonas iranensis TaxID=76862 RepID=A0ABU0GJL4_9CELL|nr:sugar ABC transporter ATP-binding protein [Cellulomonas iranensis]MDQ0425546.1 ribose transport system ATP-binding protein [Cellulomonas iranensis]UCN14966.1 sugar ABC transporter ATP-binding protein [Cellulomonas iranensis]